MNKLKRSLALALVVCMLCSFLPVTALAATITLGDKPADDTVTGEPFDITVSQNHRIPGLVNHNGTLIAVADARYDEEYDGGGSDIVVSRSTDGKNWSYTYAAYLGDYENEHNKAASTMMDPLIISDGTTLYLFYDLFPAGLSIGGGDNTTYTFADKGGTGTGFDASGRLLLSKTYLGQDGGYYLENGEIFDTGGNKQADYEVDAWFNVKKDGVYQSNLFFSADSDFYAYPTSYIAMQTSADGASWSDPQLVNVKPDGTKWSVLGPGSGIVTKDDQLAFTTYSSDNSICLVYGTPGDWNTVKTSSGTNESSVVELADGTIRTFIKNNNNKVSYVDFTKTDSGYTAGGTQTTSVANTGGCMVSSMLYSRQYNGQDVVLVCCPNSGGSRYNGTVYAFTVDDMKLIGSFQIDTGYPDQFFAYSDMAELEDGIVAMLYEDGCKYYNGAAGYGCSHISYTTFDPAEKMGIIFDKMTVNMKVGDTKTITLDRSADDGSHSSDAADAVWTKKTVTANKRQAQLGSDGSFSGEKINLDSCLYTFTKNADGTTWTISGDANGTTVYVDAYHVISTYPNRTTARPVTITESGYTGTTDGPFIFAGTSTNNKSGSLHFHTQSGTYYWNQCGNAHAENNSNGTHGIFVLELAEDGSLTQITDVDNLKSGNQYLIAGKDGNGSYYVMHPTTSVSGNPNQDIKYDHVAKVTDEMKETTTTTTELAITAKAEGKTSFTVGDVSYTVNVVDPYKVDVELMVGEKHTFEDVSHGADITKTPDATVVDMEVVVNAGETVPTASADKATTLEDGAAYIIRLHDSVYAVTSNQGGTTWGDNEGTPRAFEAFTGAEADNMWTLEASGSGFKIKCAAGYLNMGKNAAWLTESGGDTFTFTYSDGGWAISDGTYNMTDLGGLSNYYCAGGWANATTVFDLYKVTNETTTASTDIIFTGKAAGNTTAVVGGVQYNITVLKETVRDITLYEGVVTRDYIYGVAYVNSDSVQPDNAKAFIHGVTNDGDHTEVVFSGVAAGTTEARVGGVKYNITVKSLSSGGDIADFNSIVGTTTYTAGNSSLDMTDKVIKSLRITEGASFALGVDVTGYDSIVWTSEDTSIATVSDGTVTAVETGHTLVTATVTKGGVTESISVYVTVVPSLVGDATDTSFIFYYIDRVYDTDPYYTMFLSSESMTDTVENHEMVMVAEDEVLWYERPRNSVLGIVWTADPWDDHALTFMSSTGSAGQYYPLQTEDHELGSGTVNGVQYYKNNAPYNNIVSYSTAVGASWTDNLNRVLEYSIHIGEGYWADPGCDGAMGNSRQYDEKVPDLVTSLTFISERLPAVDKQVYGVLGTTGHRDQWHEYEEGMYAIVDEYVYFSITVTQEAPHIWKMSNGSIATDDDGNKLAALEYGTGATITDQLMELVENADGTIVHVPITDKKNPPYFYTTELDAEDGNYNKSDDPSDDGYIVDTALQKNTQDVTAALNAGWTQAQIDAGKRVHEFYVVYKIQSEDNNSTLINGVDMDYVYSSTYSSGSHEKIAHTEAELNILGKSLADVVVDFGLPVTISGLTKDNLADRFHEVNTNNAVGGAKYGEVDIVDHGDGTYSVTYTPDSIIQGYDVVYLMDEANQLVNYFRVYPATTVYYEETFLKPVTSNETQTEGTDSQTAAVWTQKNNPVTTSQATVLLDDSKNTNHYGYDDVYAGAAHQNGSSGSYLSAASVGATTSFEFTGTGFDLYANCSVDSGYVAVVVQDSDGNYVKVYTVDTTIPQAQTTQDPKNEYHLPIVSADLGTHGTYTVTITKIMGSEEEVKLDGVRIYNTMADSSVFNNHKEDNPEFYELRDYVLKAINVDTIGSEQYGKDWQNQANELVGPLAGQVYGAISADTEAPSALVISVDNVNVYGEDADVQELLDNGPKNELFLQHGQTLSFKVTTSRAVQIGLKAPVAATSYTLSYKVDGTDTTTTVADSKALTTSVDMFYALGNPIGKETTYLVSITNTGDQILSVTDLKICDDPNAAFVSLTEADIEQILVNAIGIEDEPEVQMPFADVPEDSFYYESVLWAVQNGITNGISADHFGVEMACNRAQAVTFLWRAAGSPEPYSVKHGFVDVASGSFYEKAVLWAVENGITNGVDATHFAPTMECNRAQVVTFLHRAGGASEALNAENPFSDVPAGQWYTNAVLWAVEQEITNGMSDGVFGVEDICNRAQIVTFLYRAHN